MWWLIPVMVAISFLSVGLAFYFTVAVRVVKQYLTPKKRTEEFVAAYEAEEKGLDVALTELPYRAMELKSRGGYQLFARYYPAKTPSDKTVVDIHGHNSSGVSQLKYLHIFQKLGYNVLIPDNRASGRSGGKSITFGWYETPDAKLFVDALKKEFPSMRFGVYGESMGGAVALRLAAEIKPEFVISYAAYNTLKQLFDEHSKNKARFFMPAIYLVALAKTGAKLWKINGAKSVASIDCPILLMHSKGDRLIAIKHRERLSEAAAKPGKRVTEHTFDASRHTRSWSVYPEEFEKAVSDFILASEVKSE